MIFMGCGSCARVEGLAKPLSSEDSEKMAKMQSLRQLQQERICSSYYLYTETPQVFHPAHLLESYPEIEPCSKEPTYIKCYRIEK